MELGVRHIPRERLRERDWLGRSQDRSDRRSQEGEMGGMSFEGGRGGGKKEKGVLFI